MTSSEPASGRRRNPGDDMGSLGRPEDEFLTAAQVAQLLHLTPKSVRRLVQDGTLPAHRLPGTRPYLFSRREIQRILEESRVKPSAVAESDAATKPVSRAE